MRNKQATKNGRRYGCPKIRIVTTKSPSWHKMRGIKSNETISGVPAREWPVHATFHTFGTYATFRCSTPNEVEISTHQDQHTRQMGAQPQARLAQRALSHVTPSSVDSVAAIRVALGNYIRGLRDHSIASSADTSEMEDVLTLSMPKRRTQRTAHWYTQGFHRRLPNVFVVVA